MYIQTRAMCVNNIQQNFPAFGWRMMWLPERWNSNLRASLAGETISGAYRYAGL